jgi:exonuclease III
MEVINVGTLNVRGLRSQQKRLKFFNWLSDKQIDIICLQETYVTKTFVTEFDKDWEGVCYHSVSDSPHARGVTILISKKLVYNQISFKYDESGRVIILNIEIGNTIYSIVNVYTPTNLSERCRFFSRIKNFIIENIDNENNLILCGDFNSCLSSSDRTSANIDKSTEFFNSLVCDLNIKDIWKSKNPKKKGYTWQNTGNIKQKSRIDFIFTKEYLFNFIKSCNTLCPPISDHKCIKMVISNPNLSKGQGYWKMNVTVLNDKDYCKNIIKLFHETVEEYTKLMVNNQVIWDLFKIKVRDYTIAFCTKINQNNKKYLHDLENKINIIDESLNVEYNKYFQMKKEELTNELKIYYEKSLKGAQIRSRAKYIEDGEKSTSYFLNLERKHQTNNNIVKLNIGGKTISGQEEILNECVNFYENLYKCSIDENINIPEFLDTIHIKNIVDNDKKMFCENKITYDECKHVIFECMKLNKTPGIDGIPLEFYRIFWDAIGNFVVNMYEENFTMGKLSDSQRKSILTLVFKGNDREFLKNYRPISLMNTDYKILTFVLSNRLQSVLPSIINENQTGYVKGRYIGDNIRLTEDVISYSKEHNINGALVFLDFAKAFDSLEWEFLLNVLKRYNFGPNFIRWVKIIYKNPEVIIKNNGWLAKAFEMNRGVRQGCPLSALLFIICVEILAEICRSSNTFTGFKFNHVNPNKSIYVSQYADDTCLFLHNSSDIDKAIDIVIKFGKFSGLTLNVSKTKVMLLGNLRIEPCVKSNVQFSNEAEKCLGIYVGHNENLLEQKNWRDKIKKIEHMICTWKKRNLTYFGKICILKSLILPNVNFVATNTYIPDWVPKKLEQIFFSFLWDGKDKVRRNCVIGKIEHGGLNMIDVQSFLTTIKAKWADKIISKRYDTAWSVYPYSLMEKYGLEKIIDDISDVKFVNTYLKGKFSKFYLQVIEDKILVNEAKSFEIDNNSYGSQVIWGNKHIINSSGKSLYFINWIKSDLIKIKDLIFRNGRINDEHYFNFFVDKRSLISELFQMKQALSKFKNYNITDPNINFQQKYKGIYETLVAKKFIHPTAELMWTKIYKFSETVLMNSYAFKIKKIKHVKLAEFNYKFLNNILPCGEKLKQWQYVKSDLCLLCKCKENITHIIVDCAFKLNLWKHICNKLNIPFDLTKIICGYNNIEIDWIITIVSYYIFKFWVQFHENQNLYNVKNLLENIKVNCKKLSLEYAHTRFQFLCKYIKEVEKCINNL